MSFNYVTLTNRTTRNLSGTWDGREYVVAPGDNQVPLLIAEAIKRRNPIMGSDDPATGSLQYLVGIKEQGDPTSPIEQSDEIELFNRHKMKDAIPVVVIPGNQGMYSIRRNDVAASLPADATFVNPNS